jgi:hypothetical protein
VNFDHEIVFTFRVLNGMMDVNLLGFIFTFRVLNGTMDVNLLGFIFTFRILNGTMSVLNGTMMSVLNGTMMSVLNGTMSVLNGTMMSVNLLGFIRGLMRIYESLRGSVKLDNYRSSQLKL